MTQTQMAEAYNNVAYPSGVFATTHPQHLAMLARLAGLDPAPPETARVLEIGGGDGMNVMAMAAAYPNATFLNFDLAEAPVARGQEIAAAAGLTNVRIEVGDILDAAERLEGTYDYIFAHGVYAWVPGVVRKALMRLIGRVLSPNGVAFISYNAMPGGHLRLAVREMALHQIRGITDPAERVRIAQSFLTKFAEPQEDDRAVLTALRDVARPISRKPFAALHHDELADIYEPQAFTDVVAAAEASGLRFLNEADPGLAQLGLPGTPMSEADVVAAVQQIDHERACFFHQTLFVRAEQAPARTPAYAAIRDLYAAAQCERTNDNDFSSPHGTFGISDLPLADAIEKVGAAWPGRLRIGDLVDDEMRLEAVYRLAEAKALELHSTALPGVRTPGERPTVSPLIRTLIERGEAIVFTLDQRSLALDEPGPRAFLMLLDGSRDRAALERDWAASGYAQECSVEEALARFAPVSLFVA